MTGLTQAELGIWLGHARATDPSVYNACECLRFNGPFAPELLVQALEVVLKSVPWLLACFFEGTEGPIRRVPETAEVPGLLEDLVSTWDVSHHPDPEAALLELADVWLRTPFSLERPAFRHALVRLNDHSAVWVHVAHHLLLDGFGFHSVARRVAEAYATLENGGRCELPAQSLDRVIAADRDYQRSSQRSADLQYWSSELEGPGGIVWGPRARSPLSHARRHRVSLAPWTLPREHQAADWFAAGVCRWIARKTGERRFRIGLPTMLRLGTPALQVPCMAMNILPLTVDARKWSGTDLRAWASSLEAVRRSAKPHERFRYEHMRALLGSRSERLFGPVVNFLPFEPALRFGNASAERLPLSAGPVEDLAFTLSPKQQGLELTLDAHPDVFSADELQEWERELRDEFGPGKSARGVRSFQGREERKPTFATPANPLGPTAPLEAFLANAERSPGRAALVAGARVIGYGELARAVAGVRRWLRSLGVGPEGLVPRELVAIDLRRCPEAIAIVLGVISAGAAYVPLERTHPASRYRAILREAAPSLVVTDLDPSEPFFAEHPASQVLAPPSWEQLVELSDEPVGRGHDTANADDLAYVIFTSGSTGTPKGVCVERGALGHFLDAAGEAYAITAADRVLGFASLSFDTSIEEIFLTLSRGATLVLRPPQLLDSFAEFAATLDELGVTVLDLPTAFFHEWVLALERGAAEVPRHLRLVILGGEAALLTRVSEFRRRAPTVRLINSYGPSEATVVVTTADLQNPEAEGVPIGRPLPGVVAHVLTEEGGLLTGPGVGELALGGPTLALGYWRSPGQTAQKFVHYASVGRLYLTGDRVRRAPSGELFFEGRLDDEFKLSGLRVVPAEVERLLRTHEEVEEAVVVGIANAYGQRRLVAHVQSSNSSALASEALRTFLRELLPRELVPGEIFVHAQLPKSAQGKLDRTALRRLSEGHESRVETLVPATEFPGLLPQVLAAFREVLSWGGEAGVALAPDDDFFVVGGTSLQVLQVVARLGHLRPLRASDVFAHSSARALAAYLGEGEKTPERGARHDDGELDLSEGELIRAGGVAPSPRGGDSPNVVLTGALGFVGGELLRSLLTETSSQVTCLVRRNGRGDQLISEKLSALGLEPQRFESRLRLVEAELTTAAGLEALRSFERVDAIFHVAARVSLNRDYGSLRADNVLSTRNLLVLAAHLGSEFHQISTIAVTPKVPDAPEDFVPVHAGLVDGYQQSKWQAEELCRQAGVLGVPVAVYRLARVTAPERRPEALMSDIFWRIARAAVRVKMWPELEVEEVWTPVDGVAGDLIRLQQRRAATSPGSVYHITYLASVRWSEVVQQLEAALGHRLVRVSLDTWRRQVAAQADAEDHATLGFFERRETTTGGKFSVSHDSSRARQLLDAPLLDAPLRRLSPELLMAYCQDLVSSVRSNP